MLLSNLFATHSVLPDPVGPTHITCGEQIIIIIRWCQIKPQIIEAPKEVKGA